MAKRIKDLDITATLKDDMYFATDSNDGTKSISLKTLADYIASANDNTMYPLINWNYAEPDIKVGFATYTNGAAQQWLFNNATCNQIYDPGKYANFIYPLKEDFTKYNELMIVFGDYSGGTPDIPTKTFKTRDFDFMLSLPKNSNCKNLYSVLTPNSYVTDYVPLWLPYNGSAAYSFNQYARSTRTKLMAYPGYGAIILEIYGIGLNPRFKNN